jgi:hypothetical protein
MSILEHQITFIGPGARRFKIAPRAPADLLASVRLSVRPGGLREDSAPVDGQDGITRTKLGYDDAEVTAEIRCWDESQMARVKSFADLFRARRGQEAQPLQVVHPACDRWGIRYLYIFKVEEPAYDPVEGYRLTLQMREWQPRERRRTTKTKKVEGENLVGEGTSILQPTAITAAQNPPSKRGTQ